MSELKRRPFDPSPEEENAGSAQSLIYSTFSWSIGYLRPYAPQVVPIVVCVFFIPVILALSALAGYTVWNSLSSGWEVPLYLQYGDGVTPYATSLIPSLHSSQRYNVLLHLEVPALESNFALGNFMANVALSTTSNKTLIAVKRPAVAVAPASWWPFWTPTIMTIDIPMLSSFVPGHPTLLADVQVGRSDNWRTVGDGTGRELSVVAASLRGLVVPHGIRGLAIRFPLLSSFAAALIFLTFSMLILGTCLLPLMLPSDIDSAEGSQERAASVSSVPLRTAERPRRKKRPHLRRTSETNSSPNSSVSAKPDLIFLHPSR
ncbi:hypothetical protein NMY22_g557 [Coprinellus aureogranulatus]|nr:hypothetical protein NMY22_g557 [Coprinellus aureogranulatus]